MDRRKHFDEDSLKTTDTPEKTSRQPRAAMDQEPLEILTKNRANIDCFSNNNLVGVPVFIIDQVFIIFRKIIIC